MIRAVIHIDWEEYCGFQQSDIFQAIQRADVEMVECMLPQINKQTPPCTLVERSTTEYHSLICYAVLIASESQEHRAKSLKIVDMLLKAGLSPNYEVVPMPAYGLKPLKSRIPINIAIGAQDADLVHLLLKANAIIAGDSQTSPIVEAKDPRVVKILANHPAVPFQQKCLGLEASILNGLTECCKLYLEAMCENSLEVMEIGMSFMDIAASTPHTDIMQLLIDFNLHKDRYQFPLHRAVYLKNCGMVDFLLATHLFHLEKKDLSGNTPLLVAARQCHVDLCKKFVQLGSDINATATDGFTLIIGLILANDSEFLKEILAKDKTNVNTPLKGKQHRSPVVVAATSDNSVEDRKRLLHILAEAGADTRHPNILNELCEKMDSEMLKCVLEEFKPRADSHRHPFRVLISKPDRVFHPKFREIVGTLFKCAVWSGEFADEILALKRITAEIPDHPFMSDPVLTRMIKFYEKWPILKLLWLAYLKPESSCAYFSRLPWPLMAQLLHEVGGEPTIPALYDKNQFDFSRM